MLRIAIADDHPIVLRGLVAIVGEQDDMEVVGEAQDCASLLATLDHLRCDMVILGIADNGRGPFEVLSQLRVAHPGLPVLFVSAHSEERSAVRALKGGASGYLLEGATTEELTKAIKKVASGGRYVSEALAERLAWALDKDDSQPLHAALSDREFQVLRLLGSGLRISEIARDLALSPKTVSTYRARVMEKLGKKNTGEVVRYAIEMDLVD